ncbi:hypothetical protein scyTo_0000032 [Scyliorhinus torazame]|uniref:Uncharacterized protein n=1 Tax=Scyliorhinus torazame TaxID=75743 RepID=A0A401NNH9_SCYTO|nr:hypothetical protein [Scyliorhinus torazame]
MLPSWPRERGAVGTAFWITPDHREGCRLKWAPQPLKARPLGGKEQQSAEEAQNTGQRRHIPVPVRGGWYGN